MTQNKRIVIAGGSGFIGQALCNYFAKNNSVIVIGRQLETASNNSFGKSIIENDTFKKITFCQWDGKNLGEWTKYIDGADMVINLAGKSVNCRYTATNKKIILESRINATQAIGLSIQQATHPPALWINAASATIYPFATHKARDESFIDFKDDFSVQVCKQWENKLYEQRTPFTRKVALRMAITLGNGGVMQPYFNLLKYGLGGKQGSGKQMYSWVHIQDVCRMIDWLFNKSELEGTFNCCSPNAVTNDTFMETLRKVTNTKIGLPAFSWMLKIGAALIGTETELVLKSRWVYPEKILKSSFQFQYPHLCEAMKNIVDQTETKRYKLF